MKPILFDEHSSVLAHWWERGVRGATLVCFDAHLDLQKISADQMSQLRSCETADEVRDLARPHHLFPSLADDRSFSYGIEDFLFAAHELGIVERLIWVTPPHIQDADKQQVIEQLRQMDGVSLEDLQSLHRSDDRISGKILGLPLTVCGYESLADLDIHGPCLLDFDIDYFVNLPNERIGVDPQIAFATTSVLDVDQVTITRSLQSGFTPLRYRFVGQYLAALANDDAEAISHYQRLLHVDQCLLLGHRDIGLQVSLEETVAAPDCPASHYFVSLATQDVSQADEHGAIAADLCDDYQPNLLRTACEFPARHLPTQHPAVSRLAAAAAGHRSRDEFDQSLLHAAIGLLWCAVGDLPAAVNAHQSITAWKGHPELALEIGKLQVELGDFKNANEYLQIASRDPKFTTASQVYQAIATANRGDLVKASQLLATAHERAPIWNEPVEVMIKLKQASGDLSVANELHAQLQTMQTSIRSIEAHL